MPPELDVEEQGAENGDPAAEEQVEGAQLEEQQDAGEGDAADEGQDEGDSDEVVVTLGEETQPSAEEDPTRAPEWVRELRRSNREKDRRIRELEQKVQSSAPTQAVVVGDKPTLEGCEYDAEKFGAELEAWHTRKRDADEQTRTREQAEAQQRAQWQTRIDAVTKAAGALKVKDYDEAALAFEDTFSIVQQGIIVGGPDDAKSSALLRYALGKNPKKAKELAAITDPVKFAFAVSKLETQLKVTPRKLAPTPDRVVRSSVAGATAIADTELKRLQDQADKTGDRSKVAAYLRGKQQRAAA